MLRSTLDVAEHVVIPALKMIGYCDPASIELVLGTGLHESGGWKYNKQVRGPAVGMWQIEPRTAMDIIHDVITHRHHVYEVLCDIAGGDFNTNLLINNDVLCAAMCRLFYLRVPAALPKEGDVISQAKYWKQHYNTKYGKGSESQYISAWESHVDYAKLQLLYP
jgi:hypothetical protein